MIVGCYSLHLYCDHPRHNWPDIRSDFDMGANRFREYGAVSPGQFTGETYAEAKRAAERAGWAVKNRSLRRLAGHAICPWHR